jgi:hypothetical protein
MDVTFRAEVSPCVIDGHGHQEGRDEMTTREQAARPFMAVDPRTATVRFVGALALTFAIGVGAGLGLPRLTATSAAVPAATPTFIPRSVGDIIAANQAEYAAHTFTPRSVGDIIAANMAAYASAHPGE